MFSALPVPFELMSDILCLLLNCNLAVTGSSYLKGIFYDSVLPSDFWHVINASVTYKPAIRC